MGYLKQGLLGSETITVRNVACSVFHRGLSVVYFLFLITLKGLSATIEKSTLFPNQGNIY